MSAYVNCGMIDPLRMARDGARVSEKFVSEFCGFRESAHLWCLRNPGAYLDASRAVPAWARNQLRATDAAPDVEALARGASGDAYWDDCQKCLVLSGELHNNVRMAWGKAIPAWHGAVLSQEATPATRLQAALDLLVRLNDTYALDEPRAAVAAMETGGLVTERLCGVSSNKGKQAVYARLLTTLATSSRARSTSTR